VKILYAVTAASFGGAVRHVIGLMSADVESGHRVGLVAAPEPFLMSEARRLGVQVFPARHFVQRVRLHDDFRALWSVFRAVRRFDPDVVSAHSTKAGYAARLVCAVLRKPVVFTAHGWAFTDGRSRWQRSLLALAERAAAWGTARIICVSRHDLALALEFRVAIPAKLKLIHNGVDPTPFTAAVGGGVRARLGLGEATVITMVGRLSPPKDPLTLLRACTLLRADSGVRVLFAGDGDLRRKAEEFVAENKLTGEVTFLGETRDVPQVLAASDIFVLPSRWEGLPLAVIEAQMAGRPVVAAAVGGMADLVEDGVTGFLVPPSNPGALAKAIQTLLDDPALRRRLGTSARARALREFTAERMLRETNQVLKDVMEDRRGRHRRARVNRLERI
jgi:glycosyltransferase involved in cell wall biosynthesis